MDIDNLISSRFFLSASKKVVSIITGFLFLVLSTRYLGPYLRGEYVYILNVVTIASTVLNLGISNVAPSYYRKYKDVIKNSYFSLSIFQALLYALVSVLLFFLEDITPGIVMILTTMSVLSIQLNGLSLLIDFKGNTIAYVLSGIINVILIFIAYLFLDSSLSIVLSIWFVKELIISGVIAMRIKPKLIYPSKKWLSILSKARYPLYATVLISLNYRMGVVVLKWMNVDPSDIGIYALGVSIAEYTWIFTDIFKDVLVNVNANKSNISVSSLSMRLSFTIIIVCLVIAFFIGKPILTILFGTEFSASYSTMMLMFLAVPFMSYTKLVGTIFQAEGRWNTYIAIIGIAAILNILLCIVLIPIINTMGAALAAMVSYLFSGIFSLVWYCREFKVSFNTHFLITKKDILLIYNKIK